MRRMAGVLLSGALTAVTAGCLPLMPVSTHYDRSADFTRYSTYAWGPADALPVTDPRLRDTPFFIDDLHGAIDVELQSRGLRRATAERTDLLVHFHAAVNERIEVPARVEPFRQCAGRDRPPIVTDYEAGTIVIDLVDAFSQRVIWRGWAEHRLEDVLDEPQLVGRRVREAVHRIMDRLPLPDEARSRAQAREVTPTFAEPDAQLSSYRTYAWEAVGTGVPGDPRLDNNPFFHEYLRGAIDRHLVARGFEPTGLRPDVYVHYHASTRQKILLNGPEPTVERCAGCGVQVYDEGSILIDLIDARTGALVWRGAGESGLAGVVNDQTRMEETIERVVGRILTRLPRRS